MTDGIIQKVLKKYRYRMYSNDEIQQELIKEITQKIHIEFGITSTTTKIILRELIGDNQE